jgi:hypothetical protein
MKRCLVSTRTTAAAIGLLLALLGALPVAAFADATARGYQPAANHLSVVVTTNQVYVTWTDPPGVVPTRVFAYRGDGSACPTGPADGTPIGSHSVTRHLIDGTVQAGHAYCYTVFVSDSTGTLVKVGSTGAVPVPDLKAPPPTAAPSTSPVPQPAGSSSNGLNATQKKAIVGSAGVLLALSLLVVIVRLLRRSRTPHAGGPVWGTELRVSFTGLSASALIIPAVIALAWVLVVTVLVVFR